MLVLVLVPALPFPLSPLFRLLSSAFEFPNPNPRTLEPENELRDFDCVSCALGKSSECLLGESESDTEEDEPSSEVDGMESIEAPEGLNVPVFPASAFIAKSCSISSITNISRPFPFSFPFSEPNPEPDQPDPNPLLRLKFVRKPPPNTSGVNLPFPLPPAFPPPLGIRVNVLGVPGRLIPAAPRSRWTCWNFHRTLNSPDTSGTFHN